MSTEIDNKTVTLNFSTKLKKVHDLPILDRSTYVNICFRKMKCNTDTCEVNYFNEPLNDYVSNKKRYSNRLIELLIKVSLTESAEARSRILKEKNINVSPDKLLQLAKEFKPQIDKTEVISIGVDNFSF